MAKNMIVQVVDDLDGTDITEGGETVAFALDGTQYEVDLSDKHAEELRNLLSAYTSVARRISGPRNRKRRSSATSKAASAADIRTWAKENGLEVPERGRVPDTIRAAYEDAH